MSASKASVEVSNREPSYINGDGFRVCTYKRRQRYRNMQDLRILLLSSLHQQVLKIQQSLLWRIHIHKRGRNTGLPATACTTNLVDVILNLLRHGEDNYVLNVVEIETLGSNAGGNHDILGSGFEGLDGVLPFFLSCAQQVRY